VTVSIETNATIPDEPKVQAQPYQTPKLTALGDVRDLTLGGSPGTGDSGNPGIQQF
jgi:hypothetical protein